ncbi:unnamed protein product [Auanema sp. JU1783]|nr:unnamed protein product [Auanema sp. JU1783]
MIARQIARPLIQAVRQGSHSAPAKYIGQNPTAFVHDGWATARLPFHATNKWGLAVKSVLFLAVGFWAPFLVVEYQLRKANSNN